MDRTAMLIAAAIALAATLPAAPAQAITTRTFIASFGTDSGTCARPTPCRTLQFAHDQTAPNGEVGILDSAGYGPLTISKPISIVNPGGVEAGILAAPAGTAVTINAGGSDNVSLRGLTLEGAVSGQTGIKVFTAGRVTIVDCVVRNFTSIGIDLRPSGATTFFIANTLVADNANYGIYVSAQGTGTAGGAIDHVAATGNSYGILVDGTGTTSFTHNVTITNSVMHGNTIGVIAVTSAGHAATAVTVSNSSASSNDTGFVADGTSTMRLSATVATANLTGVSSLASATIYTFGNNLFRGNLTDVFGTLITTETLQ